MTSYLSLDDMVRHVQVRMLVYIFTVKNVFLRVVLAYHTLRV